MERTQDELRFLEAAAIAAMAALIRNDNEIEYTLAAGLAFDHADAMLKARRVYDE